MYLFWSSIHLLFTHICMLNLPDDDKSKDMILRAAVFSFNVWVTVGFGFLTRLPKVEFAQDYPYDVLQRVETGDFCLTIESSNFALPIFLLRSSLKTTLSFLLIILTLQKPKARSMFLSYLIKSWIAKKSVLRASLTTSTPRHAAAATGTGLA
jgi:hypothetical protein